MILRGSLKSHWMMYINYVNIKVNPADINGLNISNYMYRMLLSLKSQYI